MKMVCMDEADDRLAEGEEELYNAFDFINPLDIDVRDAHFSLSSGAKMPPATERFF